VRQLDKRDKRPAAQPSEHMLITNYRLNGRDII